MALDDEIVHYPAEIVLCDYNIFRYKDVNNGVQSLNQIRQYQMSMEVDGNVKKLDNISEETLCCPIRVCSEGESSNLSKDWTSLGSNIRENKYKNIPRFWPVDWVFPYGVKTPPSHITIHLGKMVPGVMITCEVTRPNQASVLASFADIYAVDLVKHNTLDEENNMSLFKKKAEKSATKNEMIIVEPVVDQNKDNNKDTIMEEFNMSENETQKKSIFSSPKAKKALKIAGITLAVAGVAIGAYAGAKHFGLIGGKKSSSK